MEMQNYEVKGTMMLGDEWVPYTKIVSAPNENLANERIYAIFGSKHRLKRRHIKIDDIKPVNGE